MRVRRVWSWEGVGFGRMSSLGGFPVGIWKDVGLEIMDVV